MDIANIESSSKCWGELQTIPPFEGNTDTKSMNPAAIGYYEGKLNFYNRDTGTLPSV